MKHPEFEKLVKKFEGLLPVTEEREIADHLLSCADCAAVSARLENFFSYSQSGKSEHVSQADTARLLNIFQPRKDVSAKKESKIRRLLAALVFDDWQMALNERFTATDSRHLLYRADRFEIDLRLLFIGGKCQLSGQVFPDCASMASAEISSADAGEMVSLNNYCEFVFPPVKEGVYSFRIKSDGQTIEIENLSLIN